MHAQVFRCAKPRDAEISHWRRPQHGMPHHGDGWSAAFLAVLFAVLLALASANAPVLSWDPVEDLLTQVYEYRTDHQILIETGTPKNGRYNGAKLNGRGPHAT